MHKICSSKVLLIVLLVAAGAAHAADAPEIDYQAHIAAIFTKYCTGCHNDADLEGGLSLESFASLEEGGADGAALLPGQSVSSRMIRMLTGELEPKMPPDDNSPPSAEEIALLRAWIDAGAHGPDGQELQAALITPYIPTREGVADPITALALSPDGSRLAVGRFGKIAILGSVLQEPLVSVKDLPGKVNAISFSADGTRLVIATGIAGLRGTALILDAATGETLAEFVAHRDTLYDAALSPDGTQLATCSYDRQINLWDVATGEKRLTLTGHNGPVFDLAFSPDGQVLASASGDETIKLWRTRDGLRLDTLSQPLGEQYAVAFSPDGQTIVGGGGDNRIRVWRLLSREEPQINPLLYARFAHEGAIVGLAFTADGRTLVSAAEDRTLKAWQTANYTETQVYESQPDVVSSVAVSPSGRSLVVARLDGTWQTYPLPEPNAHADDAVTAEEPRELVTAAASQSGDQNAQNGSMNELTETEPNDTPDQAMLLALPAKVAGVIHRAADDRGQSTQSAEAHDDVDLYRFHSAAGQAWMIEINAARQESPLDSFVEVLDADGNPIERVLLQAVRDSYFTFRGKDSFTSDDFRVHNWEEMKLNQFLYANGEVVKLWIYPRGPDSGFMVYPGEGNRHTYFDTTPLAHALGQPCYIVEPHPPGTKLIPNGLPAFTIYYENDDDSRRQWGTDSRLAFTAPYDGEFLIRVSDARGYSGEDFKYELTVRPRTPDFHVHLASRELKVAPGTGAEFRVTADRRDGFEDAIHVELTGLPAGFTATTPLVIEPGQIAAYGVITAAPDAEAPPAEAIQELKITATAHVAGAEVEHEVEGFNKLELAEPAKLFIQILPVDEEDVHSGNVHADEQDAGAEGQDIEGAPPSPDDGPSAGHSAIPLAAEPLELTISPGGRVAARVRLIRRGFDGEVALGGFDAGRNLPHGIYVDNIGLNGLTILAGQNERVFFITADDWVPEQTRTFHLKSGTPGNPTSQPVVLRVRR